MSLPPEGAQVEYWRRDKGGPSQRITGIVLETIEPSWCVIQRDDTGETKVIDPKRLRVIKLPPGPPEPLACLNPAYCGTGDAETICEHCATNMREGRT